VGFCLWSRSYLGSAYARITEASTSFPVAPRAPGFGKTCVSLVCVRPLQGAPIGCSSPRAPLEGSSHAWPWGSLNTRPRGLSHATPLGGCCMTGHDPSPAHTGGRVTPDRGLPPQSHARSIHGRSVSFLLHSRQGRRGRGGEGPCILLSRTDDSMGLP